MVGGGSSNFYAVDVGVGVCTVLCGAEPSKLIDPKI